MEKSPPNSSEETKDPGARRQRRRDLLLDKIHAAWQARQRESMRKLRSEDPAAAKAIEENFPGQDVVYISSKKVRPETNPETAIRAFEMCRAKTMEYISRGGDGPVDVKKLREYVLEGNAPLRQFSKDQPKCFAAFTDPEFAVDPSKVEAMQQLLMTHAANYTGTLG